MTGTETAKTIALVDDHVLIVDGLAHWIEVNAPDFRVVATAGSWEALLAEPSFPPDVVVMARQIDSPTSLAERIRSCKDAGARVVVMSTESSIEVESATLAAGADAFVPKSQPADSILRAARRVLGLDESPAQPGGDNEQPPRQPLDEWSRRVLRLYSKGESTVDIALIEGVRFEKVRTSLKRIRAAYEAQGRRVDTRDELLRRAAEDGYLAEDD